MTGKSPELDLISPECFAEVNPVDAERMGIKEKDLLRLTSRRGSVEMRATITDRSQEGTIFSTYNHLATLVNLLTLDALDRLSRSPEYKLCAIRVEIVSEN
jgi:predicted molibdopterin-dependent oxidoreductase YjgC